ncbi:NUDIX hydrolase [Xanthobacteraceae bacterium A53D]
MTSVPQSRAKRRMQYAALPYRQRQDGEIQIRLITSRETRRWVIPKGWPMKGLSPAKAAAREAYEEAGLLGSVSSEPIGMYSYDKRLTLQSVPCDVMVFPLKVKRYLKKWPERSERFGFWFSVESAAAAVQEPELSQLILDFGQLMAKQFAQKRSRAPAASAVAAGEEMDDAGVKLAKRGTKLPRKGPSERVKDAPAMIEAASDKPEGGAKSASKSATKAATKSKAAAGKKDAASRSAAAKKTPKAKAPEAKAAGAKSAGTKAAGTKAKSGETAKPEKPAKAGKSKGKGQRAVPMEAKSESAADWRVDEAVLLPADLRFPFTRH